MRLLIDTQVFIWLVNGDSRLSAKTRAQLVDPSSKVMVSYFSFMEMSIKSSIGKLDFDISIIDSLNTSGIELIEADTSALKGYKVFNTDNKDPFDNMLLSVAIKHADIFVTSDSKILSTKIQGIKLLKAN